MVTFIKIIGSFIVCGSVYYIYVNRERIRRKLKDLCSKHNGCDLSDQVEMGAFSAFLPYANDFDGLYEPLYKGAKGLRNKERMLNTFNEWSLRMRKVCIASPELYSWWNSVVADLDALDEKALQARLGVVLDMLQKVGIVRDSRSELIADKVTSLYYLEVDDETWSTGEKLVVDSPCWYLPTTPPRIIEKGYCIKKDK